MEIARVRNIEERYGFRFADLVVKFLDYNDIEVDVKIILDSLFVERAALSQDENKDLYQKISAEYDIKNKRKLYAELKKNPFFNALQVKFGYAITCHKAQGGQWDAVFIDQSFFYDDMINTEYYRWLYTAFTRASKKLILVNFKENFFNGISENLI